MATPMPTTFRPPRPGRLRLRHKFTLALLAAALLPVAATSILAVRVVLGGLDGGVKAQTERTLGVALNLVLRNVKDVFEGAVRLAENPRLSDGMEVPGMAARFLEKWDRELPTGLVEIADATGRVVARKSVGGQPGRVGASQLADRAPPIMRALGYERRVTIELAGRQLLVRAMAPVIDEEFRLRGAVVLTVPLDAEFAELLKAELAADVIFYAGDTAVSSSFVAPDGKPMRGFEAPPDALAQMRSDGTAITQVPWGGRTYAVGLARLVNQEKDQLGMFAVATDEGAMVTSKRQAWRTLVVGAAIAIVLAVLLSGVLSSSFTRPLARLHEGARAVARGEMDTVIERETGDEIGDLAEAFAAMTRGVREHQDRLAARMREITTLHEIGRAVSSVLGLEDVLGQIVEQLSGVLSASRTALMFSTENGSLRLGAAVHFTESAQLRELCQLLYWWDGPLLLADVEAVPELGEAAREAGLRGSLMAVPLEQQDDILGLMLVNREDFPFSDNDLRLVATFADAAATAIRNARLYESVQRSSEEMERKVEERTAELTTANQSLGRLLQELGQAQAQLVLSERMAGLGVLVAGIAHEVNSPAGAIKGSIDALGQNVDRLVTRSRDLGRLAMDDGDRQRFFELVSALTPKLATARLAAPAQLRRQARELSARLAAEGLTDTEQPARALMEIGVGEDVDLLLPLARRYGLDPLVGYLEQHAYLHRNIHQIRTAITSITRIVGALKDYSHLDQAKVAPADIHDGIESTLVILQHELSGGIVVTRRYADLPPIPVYVDELNQVWTNLIHNAVQAIAGPGAITIESRLDGAFVEVAIMDNGPGIPPEIESRIFEPFFTTKGRGQGSGLGLGIVKQILEKHGGRVDVTSVPGATQFTVRLPVGGPPAPQAAAQEPMAPVAAATAGETGGAFASS